MRILVGISPRSYREAIGVAFQGLRPHMEVTIVETDALDAKLARSDFDLVLANRPYTQTSEGRPAWVEFHADPAKQSATIYLGGRYFENDNIDLGDLLAIADRAETLTRTDAPSGGPE